MINFTIEVAPEEGGGWKITMITPGEGRLGGGEILGHRRRKSHAIIFGAGAASALHCELKVHRKRDGRYSKAGGSFGHDPRSTRG